MLSISTPLRWHRLHSRARAASLASLCALTASATAWADTAARPGSVRIGQRLYQARCTQCHAIDEHRVGPAHRGVFGRIAGGAKGYDYSTGLQQAEFAWTADNLNRWLQNPDAMVMWQQMDFRVDNAQDRADLIAYLATLK